MIPTGNFRCRTQRRFFGAPLLVVQIEETGYFVDCIAGQIDGQDVTRWRDARVEDLPFKWFRVS